MLPEHVSNLSPCHTYLYFFVKVPTTADRDVSFILIYGLCAVSLAGSGELSDEAAREDQFPRISILYLVEKVMTCCVLLADLLRD